MSRPPAVLSPHSKSCLPNECLRAKGRDPRGADYLGKTDGVGLRRGCPTSLLWWFHIRNIATKEGFFARLLDDAGNPVVGQEFFPVMSAALVAGLVPLAPEGFDQGLQVLKGVIEVHDLDGPRKVIVPELLQARGSVDE